MVFSSLSECVAYVEKCMGNASVEIGNELEDEGKRVIGGQVGGITGTLQNSVRVNSASSKMVEVEIFDSGFTGDYSWASVGYHPSDPRYGKHFFPMYGLEYGHTWNRGATHIMDEWRSTGQNVVDKTFLSSMLAQGVPIG